MKLRRAGAASPLFLRIFLLMLVCVGVVQLFNFALIIAVQPPTPPVYTIQQIAKAIEVGKDSTGELTVAAGAEPTDHEIWAPRVDRILPALALVLGVPQNRVDFGFVKPPFPQRAPTYDRSSAPPATPVKDPAIARTYLVLDDFTASFQRPDGHWITVKPVSHAAATWRWYGLLWLVFTAAAVIPFAYWLARRLAKPIGAFAAAAERLGRDPRAPPLTLAGPAEIADAAAAFNQMQGRLNRYVDDRTTMIGALAHDLRTPLMRLELRLESASSQIRGAAQADIREMEAMVAATLAYVRDTSQPTGRRPLDLRSLTESVTDDLSDRGASVTLEPGDAVVLEGNPVALKSMLSNLITNALKYAGDAQVRLERDDDQVCVEVRDHGPGIPIEDLDRMFEPFFRGERSRNRKTGGIGLGLASARAVARAHGGDVTLVNCSEGGLSARVTLPA